MSEVMNGASDKWRVIITDIDGSEDGGYTYDEILVRDMYIRPEPADNKAEDAGVAVPEITVTTTTEAPEIGAEVECDAEGLPMPPLVPDYAIGSLDRLPPVIAQAIARSRRSS